MGGWVGDCSSRLAVLHVSWVSVGLGGSLWVDFSVLFVSLCYERRSIDRGQGCMVAVIGGLDAIDNEISGTSGKK